MTKLIVVLFYVVLVLLLADLVAGGVHWFEDAYVREDTPLIGSLIGKANVIHHHLPRYLTRHNWWQSSWDLLAFSALIIFVASQLGLLTWQVWVRRCRAHDLFVRDVGGMGRSFGRHALRIAVKDAATNHRMGRILAVINNHLPPKLESLSCPQPA